MTRQATHAAAHRRPARARPRRTGARARYPSRHAPESPVLHHAPRRPLRGGDAVASPAAAGGLRAPAGRRASTPSCRSGYRVSQRVEQVIREEMDAIGGQEMEMPVVHPADLWKESGRYAKIGPGAGSVQGPRRTGHGPRDDPRGGRRDPAARPRQELPPAADDRLPLPDEVPRRAACPWRPHPRPRVRDEGLLLAATSTTPASTRATSKHRGAYERIFERLGPRGHRGPLRRRDHGRHRRARVHGRQRVRRGHPRPVRQLRLRRQPADRGGRQARPRARGPPADGGRRDAGHDHDRGARERSWTSRGRRPRRRPSSSPATGASSSRSSVATTTSTRRSS